jgi:hypothetical protein
MVASGRKQKVRWSPRRAHGGGMFVSTSWGTPVPLRALGRKKASVRGLLARRGGRRRSRAVTFPGDSWRLWFREVAEEEEEGAVVTFPRSGCLDAGHVDGGG